MKGKGGNFFFCLVSIMVNRVRRETVMLGEQGRFHFLRPKYPTSGVFELFYFFFFYFFRIFLNFLNFFKFFPGIDGQNSFFAYF